jgi:hypothetical protein
MAYDQPNYIIGLYKEMAKANPDKSTVIYLYLYLLPLL